MAVLVCSPSTWGRRQKGQKFKVILHYLGSSRPVWEDAVYLALTGTFILYHLHSKLR